MDNLKRFIMAKKFLAFAKLIVSKFVVTAKGFVVLPNKWVAYTNKQKPEFDDLNKDLGTQLELNSVPGDRSKSKHYIFLSISPTDSKLKPSFVLNAFRESLLEDSKWNNPEGDGGILQKFPVDLATFESDAAFSGNGLKIPFVISPEAAESDAGFKSYRMFLGALYNAFKTFSSQDVVPELDTDTETVREQKQGAPEEGEEGADDESGMEHDPSADLPEDARKAQLEEEDKKKNIKRLMSQVLKLEDALEYRLRSETAQERAVTFKQWEDIMEEVLRENDPSDEQMASKAAELVEPIQSLLADGTKVDPSKLMDKKYRSELQKKLQALKNDPARPRGFGFTVDKLVKQMVGLGKAKGKASTIREYFVGGPPVIDEETGKPGKQKLGARDRMRAVMVDLNNKEKAAKMALREDKDKEYVRNLEKKKGSKAPLVAPEKDTWLSRYDADQAQFDAYLRELPKEQLLRATSKLRKLIDHLINTTGDSPSDVVQDVIRKYEEILTMAVMVAEELHSADKKSADEFTEKVNEVEKSSEQLAPSGPAPESAKPVEPEAPAKPSKPAAKDQLSLF